MGEVKAKAVSSDPFSPICKCGHILEEHSEGFFKACGRCACPDFEGWSEEEEEEEEEDGIHDKKRGRKPL